MIEATTIKSVNGKQLCKVTQDRRNAQSLDLGIFWGIWMIYTTDTTLLSVFSNDYAQH